MAKPISELRRPEIVNGLAKALKTTGVKIPSNDDIAREAQMSRQLIRHYYPDQDDIILALSENLMSEYKVLLAKGILMSTEKSRLKLFLDFYFVQLSEPELLKPRDDQAYDALMAVAATNNDVKQHLKGQYTELQQAFSNEIQITYPDLDARACGELGFLIVSQMYGHWKMVASLGFSEDNHIIARQAMDRLIASYVDHYENPEDSEDPAT